MPNELTREQAINICDSKAYERLSDRELFLFQCSQKKLCVPFDVIHEAASNALGRPVLNHEFAVPDQLLLEFFGLEKKGAKGMDLLFKPKGTEVKH